jgi:protein TonB
MTVQVAVAKYGMGSVLPALPAALTARSRAQAWGLALAAHAFLIGLAAWGTAAVELETPPSMVRLVFVEPPPPPPPLVGAADGGGTLAALPVAPVLEEAPVAVEPKRQVQPPKPAPAARPQPKSPPKPAPAEQAVARTEVQVGSTAGSTAGTLAGVAGGVGGGTPGGVIGGRGNGAVPAGRVANPPSLISRVTPQYPRAARQRGIEGLVLLEAILDTNGRIEEDIKVLQSVPDLDGAAVAALRRWRFKPARDEQGRSVPVILEVPIRFVLR